MKALLVLAILSLSISSVAKAALDCVGSSKNKVYALSQIDEKNLVMKTTTMKKKKTSSVLYTRMNVESKIRGRLGWIYRGNASTQIQVDTFVDEKFTLNVPEVLENVSRLTLRNQSEVETEIELSCN